MIEIQTGDIIARSYRFAFGGFFRVLGIVWLPLALEFAAVYFLMAPMFMALGQMLAHLPQASGDGIPPEMTAAMQGVYRYAILLMVVGLFLRAVMMLGITREALGLNKGPSFVFFAIGSDVWRLFGAYFILQILIQVAVFVVIIALAVPAVIIGVIAAAIINSSHLSPAATGLLTGVGVVGLVVLLYGAIIYFAIRLGFLLTPVVVVEKSIAIERIWNLTKGNVWRLFVIGLAVVLPVVFVYALVMIGIFLHAWPALASMPHEGNVPREVVAAHLMTFVQSLMSAWVVFVPVAVIFATLLYGLGGSASAFAYRALVPPPKPDAAGAQAA
jgi:hypothetical protein